MTGKDNTERGRHNPRRPTCPDCGKKGLGRLKEYHGVVYRDCRYCGGSVDERPRLAQLARVALATSLRRL